MNQAPVYAVETFPPSPFQCPSRAGDSALLQSAWTFLSQLLHGTVDCSLLPNCEILGQNLHFVLPSVDRAFSAYLLN